MRSDKDLAALEGQLGTVRTAANENHDQLKKLLNEHLALIEDYRALRSDFEEEKLNREKYKRLARGQEHNPFILLLVDGDNYIFNESLVTDGADGGARAAHMLHDAIKFLTSKDSDCRIMVRVYANLATLSHKLARARLTGHHARSLAPFTAAFSGAKASFDFVDAGQQDGSIQMKIREAFSLSVTDAQCKCIFFAACHDPSYLDLIASTSNNFEKVSLVRSDGTPWESGYQRLSLPTVSFTTVFRQTALMIPPSGPAVTANNEQVTRPTNGRHDTPNKGGSLAPGFRAPSQFSNPGRFPGPTHEKLTTPSSLPAFGNVANQLPTPASSQADAGLIPVNKNGERLDCYISNPSKSTWDIFNARTKTRKVCNALHLGGSCIKGSACEFDHLSLSDEELHALRYIVREYPCPRKNACRLKECYLGHICIRESCFGPGKGCRLNRCMHNMDPKVHVWVIGQPSGSETSQRFDWNEASHVRPNLTQHTPTPSNDSSTPSAPSGTALTDDFSSTAHSTTNGEDNGLGVSLKPQAGMTDTASWPFPTVPESRTVSSAPWPFPSRG